MVAVVGIAAFMYFGLNERSSRVSPSVQPVEARTPPSIVIKTNEVVKIVEKVVERTVEKKVESKTTALEPTALPTDVAVVIGCDVSPHGGQNFYVNNVHPRNLSRFGKDARLVPLQFKLTSEVLEKVNLLVLSPSWSFMLDADEQESVRRFAETGGVVLALVGCTSSRPGESHGTTVRLLKQYGATVYDAPGEHSLSVRLVNTLAAYGAVGSEPCATYASCSADWTPLAVASEDSQKFICAVRQIGAGFLIFAPILYANSSFYSEFPWNKVLSSRLKPVRHPDDSFVGSTLDDAPYEARSSRMRFVSSVVPVEGLRWIAQLDDAAAEILTRKFGAGAFATNSVKNCIVGFLSNSMSFSWENRLKELDAIELKMFNPDPKRHGLRGWAVAEYLEQSISPHRDERYRLRGANVAGYMAAAACDELRSRYSFISIGYGPVVGVTEQIEAARKHDPDFVRYDAKGNPKAAGTPELNSGEKQQYARGRFFAMLEDLHKRKPDLFVRYHQVESGWNYDAHSYAAVIDALCTAYGSDLPRRWPDRDGKSLSK